MKLLRNTSDHNCLATTNPEVAKEWHPTKNGGVTPYDVTPYSKNKFWFKCQKGHEWDTRINDRCSIRHAGCPYCSNRKVCLDNCLATVNPKVAKEWHPTKNGNLTPNDICAMSISRTWFICAAGHEWQTKVRYRNIGKCCPYCTGRKTSKDNCLATMFPAIASEWHPTKNGNLTPNDVIAKSLKRCWFQCNKKHEWQTSCSTRTSKNGCGCPYCAGKRVCSENCLTTIAPKVAAEWHPTKNGNLTPNDVIAWSKKKYWFKCAWNSHEWQTTLCSRSAGNGCPRCNESKGEKKIIERLNQLGVHFRRQARFKNCKNKRPLPFDFIIFPQDKDPGVIEYQGEQHYKPLPHLGGQKTLIAAQARDAIKRQFCLDKKLPMLEIAYTDFDKIEELVKKFIDTLPLRKYSVNSTSE